MRMLSCTYVWNSPLWSYAGALLVACSDRFCVHADHSFLLLAESFKTVAAILKGGARDNGSPTESFKQLVRQTVGSHGNNGVANVSVSSVQNNGIANVSVSSVQYDGIANETVEPAPVASNSGTSGCLLDNCKPFGDCHHWNVEKLGGGHSGSSSYFPRVWQTCGRVHQRCACRRV